MSGLFTKLKDKFVRNNRDSTNNRQADNSHLSITQPSTHSNTILGNAPTESATFNSICGALQLCLPYLNGTTGDSAEAGVEFNKRACLS